MDIMYEKKHFINFSTSFSLAILIIYSVVGFVFLYGEYLRSGYAALLLMAYIVFFSAFFNRVECNYYKRDLQ